MVLQYGDLSIVIAIYIICFEDIIQVAIKFYFYAYMIELGTGNEEQQDFSWVKFMTLLNMFSSFMLLYEALRNYYCNDQLRVDNIVKK